MSTEIQSTNYSEVTSFRSHLERDIRRGIHSDYKASVDNRGIYSDYKASLDNVHFDNNLIYKRLVFRIRIF